jgi:leucyl aminopeptidase (aminopeptidase T)
MYPELAAQTALTEVLEALPGERLVIICDDEKRDVGEAFSRGALDLGLWVRLVALEPSKRVRTRIPRYLNEILTSSHQPDIYINLVRGISEETPFRIKMTRLETRNRVRLAHCPGVTFDMLTTGALALRADEYQKMQKFAVKLIDTLEDAVNISVTNPDGTDLSFSVSHRSFFTDTKLDWKTLKWINLPVGEVMVAPVETSLEGTLVSRTAIGGIGLLQEPVTIYAHKGKAKEVRSGDRRVVRKVRKALATDAWSDRLGEFAFGINPRARICDEFIETEKSDKTIHIAFGNNADFESGKNFSRNHMDFLITEATVEIEKLDGTKVKLMSKGRYTVK